MSEKGRVKIRFEWTFMRFFTEQKRAMHIDAGEMVSDPKSQ